VAPTKGEQGRRVRRQARVDSYYFMLLNANKQSVTANLKSEKGRGLLRALIEKSDVFVENFAPGVIERLGFGYETVCRINPRIVYARNRHETRTVAVFNARPAVAGTEWQPNVAAIIAIELVQRTSWFRQQVGSDNKLVQRTSWFREQVSRKDTTTPTGICTLSQSCLLSLDPWSRRSVMHKETTFPPRHNLMALPDNGSRFPSFQMSP
jgi:CoA-transferase family III